MHWRRLILPVVGVGVITAAILWWHRGQNPSPRTAEETSAEANPAAPSATAAAKLSRKTAALSQSSSSFQFLSKPGPAISSAPAPNKEKEEDRFKYRISNTSQPVGQLVHNDKAILLENALFDTSASFDNLGIPSSLASSGDPGAYIVQSKTAIDDKFRWQIKQLGATIISYIPNNAYLVRASSGIAQGLAGLPQTQIVLPYEPYYKLKSSLLPRAVEGLPLPEGAPNLNLLVFSDAHQSTLADLKQMGVNVVSEERSPFGQLVHIQAPAQNWTDLARLPGVQVVELSRSRVSANDLSRARVGVATNTVTQTNYLDLTG